MLKLLDRLFLDQFPKFHGSLDTAQNGLLFSKSDQAGLVKKRENNARKGKLKIAQQELLGTGLLQ